MDTTREKEDHEQKLAESPRDVEDIMRGDPREWNWEEIYHRVYSIAGMVCRGYGFPYPDLDDVVQETCVRLWKHQNEIRFDTISHLARWISVVVRRTMIDHMRSRYRRHTSLSSLDERVEEPDSGSVPASSLIPDTNAFEPVDVASAREQMEGFVRAARACLRRLPERYREVLRLHYQDGLSSEAVGKKLDLASASVRSILHRARRHLLEELEKEPGGDLPRSWWFYDFSPPAVWLSEDPDLNNLPQR